MQNARVTNPFAAPGAAILYARFRPDLSAPVIQILSRVVSARVPLAADVGCGTGQSTRALRALAHRVIGVDVAPEMVAEAPPADGVEYRVGSAESLPLADAECGLVGVGFALHWFPRDAFLAEARRVLSPGGILSVWNGGMAGKGDPGPEGWAWFGDRYHVDFPSPDRDRRGIDDATASAAGFTPLLRERFATHVEFDVDSFLGFLATQSNCLARAPANASDLAPILDSLRPQVSPLFASGRARWRMEGWVAAFLRSP